MELKRCKLCLVDKDVLDFPPHKECRGGRSPTCRSCKNGKQKSSRKSNGNAHTKKYEKSKPGYLMRSYNNMLGRVLGRVKPHLYEGLPILDRDLFYKWSLNNEDFNRLFQEYEESGYDQRLAPSVDRVDSKLGYTLDNIRWLTHAENSSLGSILRWKTI